MTSHHLIREARRRAGLTQSELAVRARTTQSAIARWETGRSQPSLEKLMQLVDCCGLELTIAMPARADAEWELLSARRSLAPELRLEQLVAGVAYLDDRPVSPGSPATSFDPFAILATLNRHEVKAIVTGALAAVLHGSPLLTRNLDIVPERESGNLEALARALAELGVEPGAVDDGGDDAGTWGSGTATEGSVQRLQTRVGPLGVVLMPTGTAGYDDLRVHAESMTVHGTPVMVAALGDVIRSMEAVGRERDRRMLPTLRRLLRLSDRR